VYKIFQITWMFLKTDMCAELVKSVDLKKYDVSSLEKVLFGGSIVNHEIHANLIKLLPNTSIIQVYSVYFHCNPVIKIDDDNAMFKVDESFQI